MRYLVLTDYPTAAALSFLLMAFILIIVIVWARIAGTEALLGTRGGARHDGGASGERGPRLAPERLRGRSR